MVFGKQTKILFYLTVFCFDVRAHTKEDVELFQKFKKDYNKEYKLFGEEERRLKIFLKNLNLIKKHNEKFSRRLSTYSMGINEFADMDLEEFHMYVNGSIDEDHSSKNFVVYSPPIGTSIPKSVDWRDLGAVTDVKKQKKCGSCWSFAATGALEGQHFISTGKLISLSEQNLIDCTFYLGNNGCNGGLKERAFQYVIDNGGIATEESYPYEAKVESDCRFENATVGATSFAYAKIKKFDEEALAMAVAFAGPVSVAVNSNCIRLQFYERGIIDHTDCEPLPLNHGMLIVGFGYDNETMQDYWILKNSWGEKWGMDGYVHVPRFRNFAGIATRASFPLMEKPEIVFNYYIAKFIRIRPEHNERQYAATAKAFEDRLADFKTLYSEQVQLLNQNQEFFEQKFDEMENKLNPLELLSSLADFCVQKYRNKSPVLATIKSNFGNCFQKANSAYPPLVSGDEATVRNLKNYHSGTFVKTLKDCQSKYAEHESNYTSCVMTAVKTTTSVTNSNAQTFNTQMKTAACNAETKIKEAFDCYAGVLTAGLGSISELTTLVDNCLAGNDFCHTCAEENCTNKGRCPYQMSWHLAEHDLTNEKISNPFKGISMTTPCLQINFINKSVELV